MNDHKEHTSHYTAADIQRYVQGKLSAREMHAMEKAALDDPFLADAIEGMQQAFTEHEESLVTGQLQQLQQQFETRTTATGKVVPFKPFRYWQAAAAAVVVVIAGVWVYSLVTNPSENNAPVIAKTEEHQPKQRASEPALPDGKELSTDSTTQATLQSTNANAAPVQNDNLKGYNQKSDLKPAQDVATNKLTDKTDADFRSNRIKPLPSAAAPPVYSYDMGRRQTDSLKQLNPEVSKLTMKDVAAEKKETAPTAAATFDDLTKARKANDVKFEDRERETELITITKNDSIHYNKKGIMIRGTGNNLSGFVKGQVTDQKNNPIANAYLQIPNNNNNFYTNKSGFFKIPVSDSVVDVTVNVSGYGTQNFRLQNNAMNQLQLQPANAALNEVEVTPIQGKKLATSNKYPSIMVHEAEPEFGWVAFDQYLVKNKKIPAGVPAATGNVLVSFQVNKKGALSDFKIEQSLSKAYDDEAIRLIMQGPSWKLLKGRKARITVMVRF